MLISECKDVLTDAVLWVVSATPVLTTLPPDCVDKDVYCPYWKVYCDRNTYVFENCRRTCKSCYVPPPPIIPLPVAGLC